MFQSALPSRLYLLSGIGALLLISSMRLAAQVAAKAPAPEVARAAALRFVQTRAASLGLAPADVSDLRITDTYTSAHNGLTHVWIQQQYKGIPLYNALFGLHVTAEGAVEHTGHRFQAQMAERIQSSRPALSAAEALERAQQLMGFEGFARPGLREKTGARQFLFEPGAIARAPISVELLYKPQSDGRLPLVWMVVFEPVRTSDVWQLAIDAQDGRLWSKYNRVLYCKAGQAEPACPAVETPAPTAPVAPQPCPPPAQPTASLHCRWKALQKAVAAWCPSR